jgi:hypothetical protein
MVKRVIQYFFCSKKIEYTKTPHALTATKKNDAFFYLNILLTILF